MIFKISVMFSVFSHKVASKRKEFHEINTEYRIYGHNVMLHVKSHKDVTRCRVVIPL